jgi:DNA-binding response OmpR family regulator
MNSGSGADNAAPAVVVVADMLFASKVRAAGEVAGVRVVTRGGSADLADAVRAESARLVLIDLELRSGSSADLIAILKADEAARGVPVIGFCSHTNSDAIAAGRAAGADRVMARSAFVGALPDLLAALRL